MFYILNSYSQQSTTWLRMTTSACCWWLLNNDGFAFPNDIVQEQRHFTNWTFTVRVSLSSTHNWKRLVLSTWREVRKL